jgi:putative flippase GtrA
VNYQEKELYHEIYPLKLFTDWGAGLIALYLLWQHQIVLGLVVAFVPSILASFLIIRTANLERLKQSSFGRYVRRYMSNSIRLIRLTGNVVMMIGAWYHLLYLIPIGLIVIVLAWSGGLVFKRGQPASNGSLSVSSLGQ